MSELEATVSELIEQWQDGDLTVNDGDVEDLDGESIQVKFTGTDGKLFVTYSLEEKLAYRTDTGDTEQFNILEDQ